MTVEKTWSKMVLVVDGEIILRGANDLSEIKETLASMVNAKGLEEMKSSHIEILNTIGNSLDQHKHFEIAYSKEEPSLGIECESTTEEFEYEVVDTGRKFDSLDDVKDYFLELIDEGEYTLEEIRNLEVTQIMTNTITFEDAEEGELDVDFEFNSEGESILDNYHGLQYVRALDFDYKYSREAVQEEVEKQVKTMVNSGSLINVLRDTQRMTDGEIDKEMSILKERLFQLEVAKRGLYESK